MSNQPITDQKVNWHDIARAYERVVVRNAIYEKLNEELLSKLEGFQKIVDLGCGIGYLMNKLLEDPAREVVGVDFSEEMLEIAKNELLKDCDEKRWTIHQSDAAIIDLPSSSFDAAVSCNLIFNLPDPKRFLEKACELVKEGGVFVISSSIRGCDFDYLMKCIREDFKKKGLFEERLKYIEIVENVNKRFQGVNSEKEKSFSVFSIEEISNLLLESGFSEIIYQGSAYANQNFLAVAKK